VNIAFSALVLVLLLLPGGLLRYGYLRGLFRRSPVPTMGLTDQLGWVLASSVTVHVIALNFFAVNVDYKVLLPIMVGQFGKNAEYLDNAVNTWATAQLTFLNYISISAVTAYVTGVALHWVVRSTGLDRRFTLLRFSNDWFYTLDQRVNSFVIKRGLFRLPVYAEPDVWIATIVETKEATYLYRGIVTDYYLDDKGNLDRLEIRGAIRRKISDDRKPNQPAVLNGDGDKRYYSIEGDRLILRATEIRTLNVQYLYAIPADQLDIDTKDTVNANESIS
jgi:hypothetical protein